MPQFGLSRSCLEADILAERETRDAEIKQIEEALQDVVGATRREELNDQITLAKLELQFWYQESTAELEVEKALRLQHLYRTIKKAVAELAQAEGYKLVILDDSIEELKFDRDSRIPPQVQGLQQIMNHKLLYLFPAIDVTDDLITRMNNEFRAAQAGP